MLGLGGVIGAGTAYAWANDLYDGYAWWFRLAALVVLVVLAGVAFRRRNACSIEGVKRLRWRLLGAGTVAFITYAILYAVTTWLGALAH